ncbi:hypothetical protein ABIA14_004852 [Sinorhizobium fredii]
MLLDEMQLLHGEILNLLEFQEKSENTSANDAHAERHIQNSNTESIHELEPSSRKSWGRRPSQNRNAGANR